MNLTKYCAVFIFVLIFLFISTSKAYGATNYNMGTSSNWNIRFDGQSITNSSGYPGMTIADINGNGKNDLLFCSESADYKATNAGALYIIYDYLFESITGTGNVVNLSDTSKFNLRIDGAAFDDRLCFGHIGVGDLVGDNKNDIVVSAIKTSYTGNDAGSLYIISNEIIRSYTGTGKSYDLSDTSKFAIRYDGPAGSLYLGYLGDMVADVDGNGKVDLMFPVSYSGSVTGTSNAGIIYVIKNEKVSANTEAGTILELDTTSNFTYRFDGGSASELLGIRYGYAVSDYDNDDIPDLALGAGSAGYNSRASSGTVYLVSGASLSGLNESANVISLADTDNYSIRVDGASANANISGGIVFADINKDTYQDIVINSYGDFSNTGAVYVIYNTLLNTRINASQNIDLSLSSDYSILLKGDTTQSGAFFGRTLKKVDFDNDGYDDLFVTSSYTDFNGTNSGSLYYFSNAYLNSLYIGTGTILLTASGQYTSRYDGASTQDYFTEYSMDIADLNNDDTPDLFLMADTDNGASDAGSTYIIYNYPHTITATVPSNVAGTYTFNGSVSVSSSTIAISGVQYQLDSNSLSGTWTSCTASDGSFNSTSESFSCNLSASVSGSHTIYIRSYDVNGSYTAQANYYSTSFSFDVLAPNGFELLSPVNYVKDTPTSFSFKKATDLSTSVSHYDLHVNDNRNKHYDAYNIPQHCGNEAFKVCIDNDDYKVEYKNENDTAITNDEIIVTFKKLQITYLPEGNHSWKVIAKDSVGNEKVESNEFFIDQTKPTLTNLTLLNVSKIQNNKVYLLKQGKLNLYADLTDTKSGVVYQNQDGTKDNFGEVVSGPKTVFVTVSKFTNFIYTIIPNLFLTVDPYNYHEDTQGNKQAKFVIKNIVLPSGKYQISVKVSDHAGNVSKESIFYLTSNQTNQTKTTTFFTSPLGYSLQGN